LQCNMTFYRFKIVHLNVWHQQVMWYAFEVK
jgi:hypothetical protein